MTCQNAKHINDPLSSRLKATFSSVVRDLWSHLCPGNWVKIGPAVVYYSRAAQAFSAEVKCRHYKYPIMIREMSGGLVQELNVCTVLWYPNMIRWPHTPRRDDLIMIGISGSHPWLYNLALKHAGTSCFPTKAAYKMNRFEPNGKMIDAFTHTVCSLCTLWRYHILYGNR